MQKITANSPDLNATELHIDVRNAGTLIWEFIDKAILTFHNILRSCVTAVVDI